jgi:hypothetical protein
MECCRCTQDGEEKLRVTLTFKRNELLDDIKNYAYVESHVMAPDTEHSKHMIADIGEEGNVDRVTRVLDLGVSICREALYPYAKRDVAKTAYDDELKERGQYVIVLNVPTTFSQTTLTLLERLIHEFLVCRVLADWLSITNPEKSAVWLAKASEAESELQSAMNTRRSRQRIVQHWLS